MEIKGCDLPVMTSPGWPGALRPPAPSAAPAASAPGRNARGKACDGARQGSWLGAHRASPVQPRGGQQCAQISPLTSRSSGSSLHGHLSGTHCCTPTPPQEEEGAQENAGDDAGELPACCLGPPEPLPVKLAPLSPVGRARPFFAARTLGEGWGRPAGCCGSGPQRRLALNTCPLISELTPA